MTLLSRRSDVLWRLGADRVLVRRVGADGLDLVGAAALVWLALDEPADLEALSTELSALSDDPIDVGAAVAELESAGLVERA